jgi:hypothetical protein
MHNGSYKFITIFTEKPETKKSVKDLGFDQVIILKYIVEVRRRGPEAVKEKCAQWS